MINSVFCFPNFSVSWVTRVKTTAPLLKIGLNWLKYFCQIFYTYHLKLFLNDKSSITTFWTTSVFPLAPSATITDQTFLIVSELVIGSERNLKIRNLRLFMIDFFSNCNVGRPRPLTNFQLILSTLQSEKKTFEGQEKKLNPYFQASLSGNLRKVFPKVNI